MRVPGSCGFRGRSVLETFEVFIGDPLSFNSLHHEQAEQYHSPWLCRASLSPVVVSLSASKRQTPKICVRLASTSQLFFSQCSAYSSTYSLGCDSSYWCPYDVSSLSAKHPKYFNTFCIPFATQFCSVTPLRRRAMPPTHYDLLEIQQDASSSEIRKAYLKAVLRSHPDKCPEEGREAATELFRKVQEAYETLSDPEARSEYNNSLVINHGPPSDPLTEPRGPPGTYTTQSLFSERPVYPHHMYTSASFTTPGPRVPVYTWHVYPRRPPWQPQKVFTCPPFPHFPTSPGYNLPLRPPRPPIHPPILPEEYAKRLAAQQHQHQIHMARARWIMEMNARKGSTLAP